MSFCYNTDEMPQELNSCLYELPMVKLDLLYVGLIKVTGPMNNLK